MHIVQVIDTLGWGGAQKMQLFLAETLRPLGIDITVISLITDDDAVPMTEHLRKAGVRVVNFPFPQLISPVSFFRLVRFLRSEKFDLLHAYLTYSNIIGPLAGFFSGIPTIASLRSADFSLRGYSKPQLLLENLSLRFIATRIMANGEAVANFARQRLNNSRKVDVVVNAVDVPPGLSASERERLRAELCADPDRPIILSVGRLTKAKGFHDLIEAFALIHTRPGNENAALVFAGGGSLMEELRAHVLQLALVEHIFFLGQRDDVSRILFAADVYVSSSHWEGTPVSVLEAMAAGLPIVATTVGESPYLLDHGNAGVLVPPAQPVELAEALISLLASPAKRKALGQAAAERIRKYYTRETWRKSLLGLYAQVYPNAAHYLDAAGGSFQYVPERVGIPQAGEGKA